MDVFGVRFERGGIGVWGPTRDRTQDVSVCGAGYRRERPSRPKLGQWISVINAILDVSETCKVVLQC
jgi:hypothetical protein